MAYLVLAVFMVPGIVLGEQSNNKFPAASNVDKVDSNSQLSTSKQLKQMFPNFTTIQKGSSSRDLKDKAIAKIPFKYLGKQNRTLVQNHLESYTLFRKMPTIQFEVSPDAYQYMIENPDVTVSLWRAMEISKMKVWQQSKDAYKIDGGDGTIGDFYFLMRGKNQKLIYSTGVFQSPFLRTPIESKGLISISTRFQKRNDGKYFVTHDADVFISFPSRAIASTARMISPVSNMIADRNFNEVSLFIHTMSMAMEKRPDWVEQTSKKMDIVSEDRKKELISVSRKIHGVALDRRTQKNRYSLTLPKTNSVSWFSHDARPVSLTSSKKTASLSPIVPPAPSLGEKR